MKLIVTALASLMLAGPAWSCSCLIKEAPQPDDNWAWEVLNGASHVFVGRVLQVDAGNKARIQVVRAFKGDKAEVSVEGLIGPGSACGTGFSVGEEFIYVLPSSGPLSACGKLNPTTSLQRAVATLLASRRPAPK